jgi:hypothetical protein
MGGVKQSADPENGGPVQSNATLSDYVDLWVEMGAPHGTPRQRRFVVLSGLVVVGVAVLMAFYYVAFGMVLGRFW